MTQTNKFSIGVTGDTGFDIYSESIRGYVSDNLRVKKPEGVYDVEVPSGAEFIFHSLNTLLGDTSLVHFLRPEGSNSDWKSGGNQISPANDFRSFMTLLKFLVELKDYGDICRVSEMRPIHDMDTIKNYDVFNCLADHTTSKPRPERSPLNLLVIHDGAGTWRQYPAAKRDGSGANSAIQLVESALEQKCENGLPTIIVNLNHDLPDVMRGNSGIARYDEKSTLFWHTLAKKPENVCVICSANTLRREGATISRRLSWEQSIEDLVNEFQLFDKLSSLCEFRHLVIRFGIAGALYINSSEKRRVAELVYAPNPSVDFFRDVKDDGFILNQNVYLLSAIVKEIADQHANKDRSNRSFSEVFRRGIKLGLQTCVRAFHMGYSPTWRTEEFLQSRESTGETPPITAKDGVDFVKKHFECVKAAGFTEGYTPLASVNAKKKEGLLFAHAILDDKILRRAAPPVSTANLGWDLLQQSIIEQHEGLCVSGDAERATMSSCTLDPDSARINIGMAIVLHGSDAVLNCPLDGKSRAHKEVSRLLTLPPCILIPEETHDYRTLKRGELPKEPSPTSPPLKHGAQEYSGTIYAPILNIAELKIIERKETESIRGIRNLFHNYVQSSRRPIKNAPPISIAVFGPPGSGKSHVVKQIAKDINALSFEGNSVLEAVEYNVAQFRNVDDLGEAIIRASTLNNYGKIPLVFFDEFDSTFEGNELGWLKYFLAPMQDGSFYGSRQTIHIAKAIFVFAGGIFTSFNDFDPCMTRAGTEDSRKVKRFRARKGPDFTSRLRGHIDIPTLDGTDGEAKPIIRRAMLIRSVLDKYRMISNRRGDNVATIDEDVVYAMLTIDRYRHGARSVEAIIQMCSAMDGRIESASLPSRRQLNMHVDADEFHIRMLRGRHIASFSANRHAQKSSIRAKDPEARDSRPQPPNDITNQSSEGDPKAPADSEIKPDTTEVAE